MFLIYLILIFLSIIFPPFLVVLLAVMMTRWSVAREDRHRADRQAYLRDRARF